MRSMREGLFWVIRSGSEWELLTFFAPSNEISHKNAWERYIQPAEKRFRRVVYNYYPRGRVVIRNGRGTVFLNQHIVTEEVLHKVCEAFSLAEPKVHAEGSRHYRCYMDESE